MTIDINTLLTNVLTAAVEQATAPLTARIEQLERHRDTLRDRLNNLQYSVFNSDEGGPKFVTVAEVDREIESLGLGLRLDSIGDRVDKINPRIEAEIHAVMNTIDSLHDRLLKVEDMVTGHDEKLENMNARLGILRQEYGRLDGTHTRLWERFNAHDDYLDQHGARLLKAEDRVTKVENRLEREVAQGTVHEHVQLTKDNLLHLEGRVGELEDRLKFRNGDGAEPLPLETVIRHHSEALVHLETQVEQLDGFDEDYLRHEIVRPIARREAELALENFDIEEAIKMSDIDVGDLLNIENAISVALSDARINIEF